MSFKTTNLHNLPRKSFLFIFAVLALILFSYTLIELNQSKKELRALMSEQAHSLLETTLSASTTALISYEEIEDELNARLLNNAELIKLMLTKNQITNQVLEQIAVTNNIFRINIFNNKGNKIFTNHEPVHTDLESKFDPADLLRPIFEGLTDTLFLGIKQARFEEGYRFAVAIAGKNRSAIVLNLDAEELLEFRRNVGFGALLKKVTENEGISYAILQDTAGIIAASGNLTGITMIEDDSFLNVALATGMFNSRLIEINDKAIFEAVHTFSYSGEVIGLLRLGLPADPLMDLESNNKIRLILLGIILFILGSILLAYVFTKQNFEILKKDYEIIEDYSQKIIQNVSDCIIVYDKDLSIKIFNKEAENLFKITSDNVLGKSIKLLFIEDEFNNLVHLENRISSVELSIKGLKRYLLVSQSKFNIDPDTENSVMVIKDMTKLRIIEEQMNRKERLVAMGELASGVAHEIRNPLNTISTITQQLRKDFEPKVNENEFYTLTQLVNKEIQRINETIKDFLRFSKPEKINLENFLLSDLLDQIIVQYREMLDQKKIKFDISQEWNGNVNWDRKQIQQVLMNLIQNSYDSIKEGGNIGIIVKQNDDIITLLIRDNGQGIPEHLMNKIFNLYFTTKAEGTGIGLSIVQRIIYEHSGTIEIESKENNGTKFIINIPINPKII